jgi:hypothetical protein
LLSLVSRAPIFAVLTGQCLQRWGKIVVATMAVACQRDAPSAIQVRVGDTAEQQRSFPPRSTLGEYLELPQARSELRLSFADYDLSCERFVVPAADQTFVSVMVVTPAGTEPGAGTYPWAGHDAHGGTPSHPARPFAMPKVQLGSRSYLFPPGGAVELTKVSLALDGHVEGVLRFEFAGDAERQATSLLGSFRARICSSSRPSGP